MKYFAFKPEQIEMWLSFILFLFFPCQPAHIPPSRLPLCWFHFCDCSFFSALVYYIISLIWFYREAFLYFLSFFLSLSSQIYKCSSWKDACLSIFMCTTSGERQKKTTKEWYNMTILCVHNKQPENKHNVRLLLYVCICTRRFCESRRFDS